MNSNIDFKDKVYEILNISDITDYIDGTLYNGKRPAKTEPAEDIIIVPLPADSEYIIQSATININGFVEDVMEGVPDYTRINSIFSKITNRLDTYSMNTYFDIDIVNQSIMDSDFAGWSFLNIRINCKMLNTD